LGIIARPSAVRDVVLLLRFFEGGEMWWESVLEWKLLNRCGLLQEYYGGGSFGISF